MKELLLIGAWAIDRVVGDPRVGLHPVVLIGKLISFLEKILLREHDDPQIKRLSGLLLLLFTVFITYATVYGIVNMLERVNWIVALLGQVVLVSFTISPNSLAKAGDEIYECLAKNDIVLAREKVSWIVGRDTKELDSSEVSRATIETIAENITDGIVSPLFFAAFGGAPLAFFYRAVNTLDSMVGYKNDKYSDFGRYSAKFDDVCNFIPARITGFLIIIAGVILKLNYKNAWQIMWRDAGVHPSPNSGWAEAPVAGALGIRLGGLNYYFGKPSFRKYMGDNLQPINLEHIKQTISIMRLTTLLAVLLFSLLMGGLR